jgi:hypothetical protein
MKRLPHCFAFALVAAGFGQPSFPGSNLFYEDFEIGTGNWNSTSGGHLTPPHYAGDVLLFPLTSAYDKIRSFHPGLSEHGDLRQGAGV